MYALLLNDMRSPNVENLDAVRTAAEPRELADWCMGQASEMWRDGPWNKAFKADSDLEWYNPPRDIRSLNDYWGGIWEVPEGTELGPAVWKHSAFR